jgi:hypothetical protein
MIKESLFGSDLNSDQWANWLNVTTQNGCGSITFKDSTFQILNSSPTSLRLTNSTTGEIRIYTLRPAQAGLLNVTIYTKMPGGAKPCDGPNKTLFVKQSLRLTWGGRVDALEILKDFGLSLRLTLKNPPSELAQQLQSNNDSDQGNDGLNIQSKDAGPPQKPGTFQPPEEKPTPPASVPLTTALYEKLQSLMKDSDFITPQCQ